MCSRLVLRLVTLAAVLAAPSSAAVAQPAHGHGASAHAPARPPAHAHAAAPLAATGLSVLENRSVEPGVVEVSLTAAPARAALVPGSETAVFAYNGRIPGPTLEAREGDRVIVHFTNELPEPTTVHWHGLHLSIDADGSPLHPVAPGETYRYEFVLQPGTAGTYWYHPHPHYRTGYQIAMGLYGTIVVRAPDDPLAHLPEQLIVLTDNRFLPDGTIDVPELSSSAGRIDLENGREGPFVFANGAIAPVLPIRSGEVQRWRIVNASAARVFRLALDGHTLLHVGSDGGLFEHPVEVGELLLANSERAEVLVRGTGAPGQRAVLRTVPYDRYIPQTRPADWTEPRDVLTLAYTDDPPATPPPLPSRLREVEPLDTTLATAHRVVVLTQGLLNGRPMDMTRVDASAALGATEVWEIENLVGMDHPFHLHGFRFQVLDRDGVAEPFPSWKDTVNVPKHSSVRIVVRYDRFPGLWMFHCHILDHEDHGMMGILEVR